MREGVREKTKRVNVFKLWENVIHHGDKVMSHTVRKTIAQDKAEEVDIIYEDLLFHMRAVAFYKKH